MHRALTIPELIHEIFSYLNTSDLASSISVVCKQWSDISADIIWRKLDDLQPLLRLLGETEVNAHPERARGYFSCKFITLYEDWSRFDFLSRRVQVFALSAESVDYHPALSDIAMLRSGMVFLPRLKELEWYGCEGDSWKSSVYMMHEGITTFTLSVPWGLSNEGYTHTAQCLGFIAARMPRLEHLRIDTITYRDPNLSLLGLALEPVVSRLTSLKTISFPPFTNTFSIMAQMTTLPHITSIIVEKGHFPLCVPSFPKGLSCSLPSRLRTLHTSTTFEDATRLFNTELPHLSDIHLESGQSEVPSTVHRLAGLISHCCRNLRELQLASRQEVRRGFTGNSFDCITIANISPLFSCSAMKTLIIVHALPLLLLDSDIRILLTRWPALEVLSLNSSPSSFPPGSNNLPLPGWKTLTTFARYGTNLVQLGLYMDGLVDVPDNKDAYPFAQLDRLIVGTSEIRGSHNEARLLSYILPAGCTISADSMMDRDFNWGQIIPLISVLQQVREEEREAKKELERRVVELEAQLASTRN